jgi:hypothetical protein
LSRNYLKYQISANVMIINDTQNYVYLYLPCKFFSGNSLPKYPLVHVKLSHNLTCTRDITSDYCILVFVSKFCSNNPAGNELYVKFDVAIQIIVVCFIYSKGTLLESPLILVFIYQKIDILRDRSVKMLIF